MNDFCHEVNELCQSVVAKFTPNQSDKVSNGNNEHSSLTKKNSKRSLWKYAVWLAKGGGYSICSQLVLVKTI